MLIPFTKIRVARKTSVSTTHCRLNEFDTASRIFGFGITLAFHQSIAYYGALICSADHKTLQCQRSHDTELVIFFVIFSQTLCNMKTADLIIGS